VDENFAASVGGEAALDKGEDHLESSLECREPGRLQYRSDWITVESLA